LALEDAERVFAEHGSELAALIVEPLMQGAAGLWAQPLGYLPALQDLAKRFGTLLICDEVATGFGRTGRMFSVEHEAVEPDLLCLGKGLTGGYLPLAATLASEEIFEAFLAPHEAFQAFFHGHTYTGNPLASAVAVANLEIFAKEQVVARVAQRTKLLAAELARKVESLSQVGDVRQWGLMVGIELVRDRETREAYPAKDRIGHKVILEARKKGVIIRPLGSIIILMPPLSIEEHEIVHLIAVVADAIHAVCN
jgi:adenosylmethionine-8-amino-7-oxononanoate aminotransferase